MTSTDPPRLSPGGTPMPSRALTRAQPAARPAAAAQALRDAASAAAAAWEQPMEPDAYSRAVSQLYSVLRDLGIAIRGLARYQIIPAPPGPADRGFAQHATTSAAWLLGAWHSLDGVAGGRRARPAPRAPAAPGDALCQAARDAITAWRQPSGTAADRDTTAGQLITAIVFLSEATLSLAGYAPRHRTIDLYAVGAGLAEAGSRWPAPSRSPPARPSGTAARPPPATPEAGNERRPDHQRAARSPRPGRHQRSRAVLGTDTRSNSQPLTHHRSRGRYSRPGKRPGFPGKAGNHGRSRRP